MNTSTQAPPNRPIRFLETLVGLDKDIPLIAILALFHIDNKAEEEGGYHVNDLGKDLELTPMAAYRTIYYLADGVPQSAFKGHNFVSVTIDPSDRRRRQLSLTPKGAVFAAKLHATFL